MEYGKNSEVASLALINLCLVQVYTTPASSSVHSTFETFMVIMYYNDRYFLFTYVLTYLLLNYSVLQMTSTTTFVFYLAGTLF